MPVLVRVSGVIGRAAVVVQVFGFFGRHGAKIVSARLGDIELELIDRQDSSGVYAEFLRDRGPGLRHVILAADDETGVHRLAEAGSPFLPRVSSKADAFGSTRRSRAPGISIEIAEGEALVPDREL